MRGCCKSGGPPEARTPQDKFWRLVCTLCVTREWRWDRDLNPDVLRAEDEPRFQRGAIPFRSSHHYFVPREVYRSPTSLISATVGFEPTLPRGWWISLDLNQSPHRCERCALPDELETQGATVTWSAFRAPLLRITCTPRTRRCGDRQCRAFGVPGGSRTHTISAF